MVEDKLERLAEDILGLSHDKIDAIDMITSRLLLKALTNEDAQILTGLFYQTKKFLKQNRIWGETGYITICTYSLPHRNIYSGDVVMYAFPDKLEKNDIVQFIYVPSYFKEPSSYMCTYLSSEGVKVLLEDNRLHVTIEVHENMILGQVIKVISLISEEGQEIFKKIYHLNYIEDCINVDLEFFHDDKNIVDELNKRLEIIKQMKL